MDTRVAGSSLSTAPQGRVWELLRDLRNAVHWVPNLERVEICTDAVEGVGASRRVFTARGPGSGGMDETVIEWTEGQGFAIRLHDGEAGPPAPMAEARFVYAVFADGAGSRIETEMAYSLRWGALGRGLDALLVRRISRSMVQQVAEGVARRADDTSSDTPPASSA